MSAPASRSYRSELRDAQASQTRARVLEAAAAEFAAGGYAGTTLAAIARVAGVSVETVKLQGAKHELLLAAWNRRLFGGEEPVGAFLDDDARRAVAMALPDEALVGAIADAAAGISVEGVGLWQAFAGAARIDAQVRAAFDATLEMRRTEFRQIVELLDARGMIANDRPRPELAAELVFLASAEGYQSLVVESGRTVEQYRAWLQNAIERLILAA